jgi:prolipoprotein diacylglyceryltransferase
MLVLYGLTRLGLEFLRTDSPLEFDGLTISQNLGIFSFLIGILMLVLMRKTGFSPSVTNQGKGTKKT